MYIEAPLTQHVLYLLLKWNFYICDLSQYVTEHFKFYHCSFCVCGLVLPQFFKNTEDSIFFSDYMNFHIPSLSGGLNKNKEINASEYFKTLKCYFELILRLVVQQTFSKFQWGKKTQLYTSTLSVRCSS